jgi:hypothetical protein
MPEDDDNIRIYAPLVRRIIILVAVIISVPVALWSITAFMRTYVAPPKVPTFRPISMATSSPPPSNVAVITASAAPATVAPVDATPSQSSAPVIEAKATIANGMPAAPVVGPSGALGNQLNGGSTIAAAGSANIGGATPQAAGAPPSAAAAPVVASTASDGIGQSSDASSSTGTLPAAQMQVAATDQDSADLPAADPITGPIPLPHARPRYLVMAGMGVPMPRPRPAAVSDADSPPSQDGPLHWLGNIFHPAEPGQQ